MTPREAKDVVTEKTPVALGLVASLIAVVVVIVAWGKTLEARMNMHETTDDARVAELKAEQAQFRKDITEIKVNIGQLVGARGLTYIRPETAGK